MLDVQEVTVRFGGINALTDVTLQVGAGEAVGLVGPNGAGKTTLFNCLLGIVRPNSGRISFDGRDLDATAHVQAGAPRHRPHLPTGRAVRGHDGARAPARGRALAPRRRQPAEGHAQQGTSERAEEISIADETLALLGIEEHAEQPVEALTLGQSRLVELGRALVGDPRLLLLDEPSSGLDVTETLALVEVLADVRAHRGTAILLVEHDLDLVRRAVDRLHVLDFGRTIADRQLCGGSAPRSGDHRVLSECPRQ